MLLRELNDKGLETFQKYLASLRSGAASSRPEPDDDDLGALVPDHIDVAQRVLSRKVEAAKYLASVLRDLPAARVRGNVGLWSWLALFYFDSLCPDAKPVADPHYLLDRDYKRRYRHLLATPYLILEAAPDSNRLFLEAPLHVHGDLIEQVVSRLYLIRKRSVREAMDIMYFDDVAGQARRGITNRKKAGTLRRLATRLQQAQMTYDIDGLSGTRLVDLLGSEFTRWTA